MFSWAVFVKAVFLRAVWQEGGRHGAVLGIGLFLLTSRLLTRNLVNPKSVTTIRKISNGFGTLRRCGMLRGLSMQSTISSVLHISPKKRLIDFVTHRRGLSIDERLFGSVGPVEMITLGFRCSLCLAGSSTLSRRKLHRRVPKAGSRWSGCIWIHQRLIGDRSRGTICLRRSLRLLYRLITV